MLPWIGERRLVIARGVDGLAAKAGESLAAYAKAPNPSTALVLVADALLEGGHWLLRALPATAVVAAPALGGRAPAGGARHPAPAPGRRPPGGAAHLLAELPGGRLTP